MTKINIFFYFLHRPPSFFITLPVESILSIFYFMFSAMKQMFKVFVINRNFQIEEIVIEVPFIIHVVNNCFFYYAL